MSRCLLPCALLMLPVSLLSQSAPTAAPRSAAILEFEQFADVYGSRLVAAFDSIPEARYDYRPMPVQQTVGYIAQHLESANYALCGRLSHLSRPQDPKDALPDTVRARWPKDTLVARLRASLRFCDDALDRVPTVNAADVAGTLLAFETDLAEHYSQISVYMRLLGLVPPSALPHPAPPTIALPASALVPYAGTYELTHGLALVVSARDSTLWVRSTPGGQDVQLWPESPTKFYVKDVDAEVSFTRDANEAVTGLVWRAYGRNRPAKKVH